MRAKLLRVRSEAQEEINEAFGWYFARSPKVAAAFLGEIENSFHLIVSGPRRYPTFTAKTRRRVLDGFPYSMIYREKEDVLLVVAVAHAKRRPGYWLKRI